MSTLVTTGEVGTVRRFRLALLALAAGTCLGAFVELAMLRHTKGFSQKIPWVILLVLLIGVIALAVRWSRGTVLSARALAVVAVLSSGIGVFEHIEGNLKTAPLSADYSETWDTLSGLQQFWLAATGGVGPAPPLAPGFLALTGICLALATLDWRAGGTTR